MIEIANRNGYSKICLLFAFSGNILKYDQNHRYMTNHMLCLYMTFIKNRKKLYKITIKFSFSLIIMFLVSSCTKDVPKEFIDKQNPQNKQQNRQEQPENPHQKMPDDSIHRNISQNEDNKEDLKGDPKAVQMVKEADLAEVQYQKTKSENDKKVCINKQLSAANYLMFEANLSPKKKYKPALQRYRRVLELDPQNSEAMENKKQIEDIYRSMGMPVPD